MLDAIKNFPEQFAYQPKIINEQKLKKHNKYIVLGMGGSHLAADLLHAFQPSLNLIIRRDYGLPALPKKELKKYLIIAHSHSGNTAEVLDGLDLALKQGLSVLIISTNGKLIKIAKSKKLPYIQMPNLGIQPRQAIALNFRALAKALKQNTSLTATKTLVKINPDKKQAAGLALAKQLKNKIPVIYASEKNKALAYIWKIKFNENSKTPAFYNVIPELNHNEMTGFDYNHLNQNLVKKFSFIFLEDPSDNPANQKRFQVLKKILQKRDLDVHILKLGSQNIYQAYFENIILADWASYYLALSYQRDPEPVPLVEEFKKML